MSRIKYFDTLKGWNERGYVITKGSKSTSKNREGTALFSWGQVVPSTYSSTIINGQASYNEEEIEGEDYPEPDRFYGDLD